HDGGIALLGPTAFDIAIAHHQEGTFRPPYDLAVFRDDGRMLFRISIVVDEDAPELGLADAVADVEDQAELDRGESTGAHEVRNDVGADLGDVVVHLPLHQWSEIGADEADESGDQKACSEHGPKHAPRRHAGGIHHHQLGIAIELVERVANCDHD